MQKFIVALVALIGATEAVKVKTTTAPNLGAVANAEGAVNTDTHNIAEEGEEEEKFIQWASENNKNYSTQEELQERMNNYAANNALIREANRQAIEHAQEGEHNPAMYNHNNGSDQSQEELAKRNGVHHLMEQENLAQTKVYTQNKTEAKTYAVESHTALTVDWTDYTKPVENQGYCGSCWAFAGNTVLEGTEYLKKGGDRPYYSQQHPVDCSPDTSPYWNFGCNGGDSLRQYQWHVAEGVVTADEYPYTSGDSGNTGSCQSMPESAKKWPISSYGQIGYEDSKAMILERPLVGGFAVSSQFNFYSYGLIKPGDNNCLSQGEDQNHAMAVVGLDLIGEGHQIDETSEELMARWKTDADYPYCQGDGQFSIAGYEDFCVWYEEVVTPKYMASGPYWKIQNSWGADWGHHGFAYFEDVDPNDYSNGNCAMFQWPMYYVTVNGE